jgi:hypothetical protein
MAFNNGYLVNDLDQDPNTFGKRRQDLIKRILNCFVWLDALKPFLDSIPTLMLPTILVITFLPIELFTLLYKN